MKYSIIIVITMQAREHATVADANYNNELNRNLFKKTYSDSGLRGHQI